MSLATACADYAPRSERERSPVPPLPATAIRDEAGRARYLVSLDPEALGAMPRTGNGDARFAADHAPAAVHLVHALEAAYGITATHMTSRVALTFSAFLTPEQATSLAGDERVTAVEPDHRMARSSDATSIWPEGSGTGIGFEHIPWGTAAVGWGSSSVRVYVLDSGITPNATELNLVQAVNAYCPPGSHNGYCDPATVPLVGCFAHSTHVAGIIGARQNGAGTRGVAPGVPIVSVSDLDPHEGTGADGCLLQDGATASAVVQGLEWITMDVTVRGAIGIINISSNDPSFEAGATVGAALLRAATPSGGYRGSFIAESAGNDFDDACKHAYSAPSASDGIMVVGALNDHAQAVRPLNGVDGSRNGTLAKAEAGSNYGGCVEVWAPGRSIFSTWSGGTYQYLSGTSMAAPHVAGLAARVAAGAVTPGQIESLVRADMQPLGALDASGRVMSIATTSPTPVGMPHSTPYAEVIAARTLPFDPMAVPETGLALYAEQQPFVIGFDSVGTGNTSCDLVRAGNGLPTVALGSGAHYTLAGQSWPVGSYTVFSNVCTSAHIPVVVSNHATDVWTVDGVDHTNGNVAVAIGSSSVIRYASTNAVNCDVTIRQSGGTGPVASFPADGNTAQVPIQSPAGVYIYQVSCHDAAGGTVSAFMNVTTH